MFLVLEGDNGTGKDTIAGEMKKLGFTIVSYNSKIKQLENQAKLLNGDKRINAFYNYNLACGNMAKNCNNPSIIIRYWISTLAAAYSDADDLIDEAFIKNNILINKNKFPVPDLIICLKCDYTERINRIKHRKSSDSDDISEIRSKRYEYALKVIEKNINTEWHNINSDTSVEDIVKQINNYIGG